MPPRKQKKSAQVKKSRARMMGGGLNPAARRLYNGNVRDYRNKTAFLSHIEAA
jgi:hypothetical protein